jgi:hypothetical protein
MLSGAQFAAIDAMVMKVPMEKVRVTGNENALERTIALANSQARAH